MLLAAQWFKQCLSQFSKFLAAIGAAVVFIGTLFFSLFRTRRLLHLCWEQCLSVGLWPFILTILSAGCMGGVLFLQAHRALAPLRLQSQLPLFIAFPLIREFAPVLSAWLLAGVLGSALTAETGLMKATDQLLSLELMGIDPYGRIFLPRFLTLFLLLPLMLFIFIFIGLLASSVVGASFFQMQASQFWHKCLQEISWKEELLTVLSKTLIFSMLIGWIALFMGFDAAPNSEGVSHATTRGVTVSLLSILFFDLLFTICTKHAI